MKYGSGSLTEQQKLELPAGVPLVPAELLLDLLVDPLLLPNLVRLAALHCHYLLPFLLFVFCYHRPPPQTNDDDDGWAWCVAARTAALMSVRYFYPPLIRLALNGSRKPHSPLFLSSPPHLLLTGVAALLG